MQRNKDELNRRAVWVQKAMNNRNGKTVEQMVAVLAKKIFVSESTIWKDVKRDVKL